MGQAHYNVVIALSSVVAWQRLVGPPGAMPHGSVSVGCENLWREGVLTSACSHMRVPGQKPQGLDDSN